MPSFDFAKKGGQRWLQVAVEQAPATLDQPLRELLKIDAGKPIEWLSPRRHERFNEYRDAAMLDKCGIQLSRRELKDFWPSGGPMWDGLARTSRGDVLLIEAKAHIPELVSPRSRATEPARGKIAASMRAVQQSLAPKTVGYVDWTGTFYQYVNRLAHLHFLREENGISAHLVNVYFVNATDVGGPTTQIEWEGAIKVIECYLGIRRHRLSRYIHKVFADAAPLMHLV